MYKRLHHPVHCVSPVAARATPPGLQARELAPGRALSLHAAQPRELHILQGRVWLTLDAGGVPGDHFLAAGDVLQLPAGTRAVLEAYPAQPVRWACAPVALAPARQGRFAREVRQPAREFGQALQQALGASARLLLGVLGCGGWWVPRRPGALPAGECLRC